MDYNKKLLTEKNSVEKYYQNTQNAEPNFLIRKFIAMNIKPAKAIDLGCGSGRDTRYLIENGWDVLAIDKENIEEMISSKLDKEELKKFRFSCQNFENIQLEKTNVLVANFSIPFCNKDYFTQLWNSITNSILKNRIFCWQFLWFKRFLGNKKANAFFYKRRSFGFV